MEDDKIAMSKSQRRRISLQKQEPQDYSPEKDDNVPEEKSRLRITKKETEDLRNGYRRR